MLREFVRANCKTSAARNAWIDLETRTGPDGTPRDGFRPRLFAHCKAKGIPPPSLRGDEWTMALPGGVTFHDSMRVHQIRGLRLPPPGAPAHRDGWSRARVV